MTDELRQSECDRENAPQNVAERDEGAAFAGSVRPCSEEEGRKCGGCRGAYEHAGYDFRILCNLGIDKRIEPLVFHVPAYLSGKPQSPDKEPH